MSKIYLFFIPVCCVQSYLLPFSCRLRLRFSLPLIKITARIDRPQTQRNYEKLTNAEDRNPPITAHTLTLVWPLCFLRGQAWVCCTDYWQQTGVHVMHLSIETPTPRTPGLCGAMWGIFMVFEGMVSPWGWGISRDLLSIFMEVHGSRGARWGFDSCLVSSR